MPSGYAQRMATFADLLTLPGLHTFVHEAGFAKPTAVQAAAIPRLLAGKSVSVLAQTGSGKTLAYALPVVQILKQLEAESGGAEPKQGAPRAWILYPTRELGTQIEKVFKAIAHHSKLRVRHLGGGDRPKNKHGNLSGIDIVISSPTRALKALANGELKSDAACVAIFDEADQLFDPTFFGEVKKLAAKLASADLQVGLFSATMPSTFQALRTEAFPFNQFDDLTLQGSHTLKSNIATNNYTVPFKDKPEHATRLLQKTVGSGFVFVNQKGTAEQLFAHLQTALPHKKAYLLHGGMEPRERRQVISGFAADGHFLVCTDIAARGLDVPAASWVLNYDLPFEAVYYMHRCGRVGRLGQPAQVYNLVTTKDRGLIGRINSAITNQSSLKLSRVADARSAGEKKPAGKKPKGYVAKGKPGGKFAARPGAKPKPRLGAKPKPRPGAKSAAKPAGKPLGRTAGGPKRMGGNNAAGKAGNRARRAKR